MSHYQLLDSGSFQKLEQVGPYRLRRPSASAVWRQSLPDEEWEKVDAWYERFAGGDGVWHSNRAIPEVWPIKIAGITMLMRLTDFGHLGIFAEQENNWQRIASVIAERATLGKEILVLNLFAYTGGATLACANAGAQVVHVDASKTSVGWARENADASGLANRPIRWIIEDVRKFVGREIRRNSRYHGIILDPPSFGRGVKGEVWKVEQDMVPLLDELKLLMDDDLAFFHLSSHSQGYTPVALENLVQEVVMGRPGRYYSAEMVIPSSKSGKPLPSGSDCLWVGQV